MVLISSGASIPLGGCRILCGGEVGVDRNSMGEEFVTYKEPAKSFYFANLEEILHRAHLKSGTFLGESG